MASRRQTKSARGRKRAKARSRTRAAWRDDLTEQLADHRIDALAIGLVVFGLLSLLAMFSDVVGPIGRGIDAAPADLLGRGKVLVPIATLAAAASTVVQRRTEDDDDEVTKRGLRFGVGLVLVCGAVVGGFHLGRDAAATGSLEPLRRAGGVVGAAIGAPLRAGLGGAGAVIVLVAIGTLGMLLVVGTGVRQIAQSIATGSRFVGRHARKFLTLPSERVGDGTTARGESESGEPSFTRAVLFDQLDDSVVDLVGAEEALADDEDEEYEYEEVDEDEQYEEEEEGDEEEEEYEEEDEDEEYAEEDYEEYD